MEKGYCEFICGAPTTLQGYAILSNRIDMLIAKHVDYLC